MVDSVFPCKKSSLFVKTYSKVRPLQTFTASAKPLEGKVFPQDVHMATVGPLLAPANSPSSDSSSSDTQDVEMISTDDVIERSSTEDDDEKTFVTLTPGSKKMRQGGPEKQTKKLCRPLKNISNVIKGIHYSKAAVKPTRSPKRTGSPFRQICSKVKPRGPLPSIQESDQESSLSDGQEAIGDIADKVKTAAKMKQDRVPRPSRARKDVGTLERQDGGGGFFKRSQIQGQIRYGNSPMLVQGRGVLNASSRSTVEEGSTYMYGTLARTDEHSTPTYTQDSSEYDESTLMITDTCSDGQNSTESKDTLQEEDYSDIEIPRDFPEPTARVMKQLTPNIAQLVLPNTAIRTAHKKPGISTTKAMPRKQTPAGNSKKTAVARAKNSTLLEGISALNIKEYGPIEGISEIHEDNSNAVLPARKVTSTPTTRDRNTEVHGRFIPEDISSIEGDACALPSIDALQSWSSSTGLDKAPTAGPNPITADTVSVGGVKPVPPLSVSGRKALRVGKPLSLKSPRVSFGQYPATVAKSSSSVNARGTPGIPTGNTPQSSSNSTSSTSSSKRVKFLLFHKAREIVPDEPDPRISCSVINLPELSPSCSILKKRDSTSVESASTRARDQPTPPSNQDCKRTGVRRMTSTPQKSSRRVKGMHMLELSFDVSAVDLPSCHQSDLVRQPACPDEANTSPEMATDEQEQEEVATTQLQCTDKHSDFQVVATSVTGGETEYPAKVQIDLQADIECGTMHRVYASSDGPQHQVEVGQAASSAETQANPAHCASPHQPSLREDAGQCQGFACKAQQAKAHARQPDTDTPLIITQLDRAGSQAIPHPVHATPRAQLKRSSPNADPPTRPNKQRFLEKGKSLPSAVECSSPQTCDRGTQKSLPKQTRLNYADKASGVPECIIARMPPTGVRPARVWQFVNNTNGLDYEQIKNMPRDILETLPDSVFS